MFIEQSHASIMNKITLLLLITFNSFAQEKAFVYPAARRDTITDSFFGTKVADPYRWLENDTLPETIKWLEEEHSFSEKYLKKLNNKYNPEHQLRINSYKEFGTLNKTGKYYFDLIGSITEGHGPACLFIKKKIDGESVKIIDPLDYKKNRQDKPQLQYFNISEDNKFIAFEISRNGSDWQEIYVKTLYPFHKCDDYLEGIKFSSIEWSGNGFFYIRYPQQGNQLKIKNLNASVCYHKLGDEQEKDHVIFENKEYPEARINIQKLPQGNYLIIYNENENNGEFVEQKVLSINLEKKIHTQKSIRLYQ